MVPCRCLPTLAALAALAAAAIAQPPPLPGIPMTPPPVEHPGLAGQPLFQPPAPASGDAAGPGAGAPAAAPAPPAVPRRGRELAAAVAKLRALAWHRELAPAQAAAAAARKPVLWLQGLGALDGLASSALQSLRGTSLVDDEVFALLLREFVLGYADLEHAPHIGVSKGYRPDQSAVVTTNGAGGRNVQLLVLGADGAVVHALAGYWQPQDLLPELRLGLELHRLHASAAHSPAQQRTMAAVLHRAFLRSRAGDARHRSRFGDDAAAAERARPGGPAADVVQRDADGRPARNAAGQPLLRPLLEVQHDRALQQWAVPFAAFDVERFVDYGAILHDENAAIEIGATFPGAVKNQQRREREAKARRP